MTELLSTAIRLSTPDDNAWIIDCWYKAQKDIYPNRYIADFPIKYHQYINSILNNRKHPTITSILCLDDDPHWIVAFMTYTTFLDDLVVHFAYTRKDQRRQGHINKLLTAINFAHVPVVFTHPCKNENIMKHMCDKYIYDPSILSLL